MRETLKSRIASNLVEYHRLARYYDDNTLMGYIDFFLTSGLIRVNNRSTGMRLNRLRIRVYKREAKSRGLI